MSDLNLFMLICIHNDLRELLLMLTLFAIALWADGVIRRRR